MAPLLRFHLNGAKSSRDMLFSQLGLSVPLVRAVAEENYVKPTAIQIAAIPSILLGADVRASAQTGSGKTAAFVLPILQGLSMRRRETGRFVRVLILVPTRELAAQVGEVVRRYGRFLSDPVKTLVVYGGVSINPQMMALAGGADVIVATPGRLLDLIDHNAVSIAAVSVLVLDEADRLLALGFSEELGRIVALLPAQRQSLLFSATFPKAVAELADSLLRDPHKIEIAPTIQSEPLIEERAIEVDAPRRTQLLRFLTEENGWMSVLVFVSTKYATEHVAEKLRRAGLDATALHGELSQGARTQALADFKAGRIRLLVATDLAARGLDIEELPVVVNFDLPRSAVDYVHRIGRTGRAGAHGVAISFVSAETHSHFQLIEKRNTRAIIREQIVGFEPVETEAPPLVATGMGGVKGKRKSKKDKLREAAGVAPVVAPSREITSKVSSAQIRPDPNEFFPWSQRVMVGRRMR
jgi:ATP-dependent RNA helicase RhlE